VVGQVGGDVRPGTAEDRGNADDDAQQGESGRPHGDLPCSPWHSQDTYSARGEHAADNCLRRRRRSEVFAGDRGEAKRDTAIAMQVGSDPQSRSLGEHHDAEPAREHVLSI
jgi:hypothetical protein